MQETVDVKIPSNYTGKPVKIIVDQEKNRERGPTNFISFNLQTFGDGVRLADDKSISLEDAYAVLRQHGGLSDRLPIHFHLADMKMFEFEANPACYSGPRSWPFKWQGVDCSFAAPMTIRIHHLPLEEARKILESIRDEMLKKWQPLPQLESELRVHVSQSTMSGWVWKEYCRRPHRDLDTIYIDDAIKQRLIQSIRDFAKSKHLYDKYGVTWKKIFLFHGPPGTGKTSTVLALTSLFKKDIARISITPGMTITSIESLLATLPQSTFVLMEDVDALFHGREATTAVDFSSVLNMMDGLTTRRGLILFMTTNHVMKLDEALKRPGRVDESIYFPPPTRDDWMKAVVKLADRWPDQQEAFVYQLMAQGETSIASIQKHLFQCMIQNSESILFV